MGRYSASAGPATAGFFLPNLVDSDSHIGSHCLLHFPATLPTQRPAPRGLRIAEKSPGCLLQFYKADENEGPVRESRPIGCEVSQVRANITQKYCELRMGRYSATTGPATAGFFRLPSCGPGSHTGATPPAALPSNSASPEVGGLLRNRRVVCCSSTKQRAQGPEREPSQMPDGCEVSLHRT
jgi:hypothetical protein